MLFSAAKLRCWIFAGIFLAAAGAHAGVVVFANGAVVQTTSQTIGDTEITVVLASGKAVFTPEQVAWCSKDDSVKTLYDAAQAAAKEGRSDVALILARESALREPASAAAARQLAFEYEDKMAAARPPPAATPPAPQGFEPSGEAAKIPGFSDANPPPGGSAPAAASAPAAEPAESSPARVDKLHGWAMESSALSAEDIRINAIVVGIFGLMVLFTLWKVTVSE